MKKLCTFCGGSINTGYIAPESRCNCTSAKKKMRDDKRQELVYAEYKYLTSCGWKPLEKFTSAKEGFHYSNAVGEGPFTQAQALDIQRKIENDPVRSKLYELCCEQNDLLAKQNSHSELSTAESQRLKTNIEMLKALLEGRAPKVDSVGALLPPSC